MSAIPLYNELPEELRETLCGVLTELCDVLLVHGFRVSDVEPLLRKAMVDAAHRKLEREGERPTVTNLGLQTGLTRDKVSDLARAKPHQVRGRLSPVSRVLDEWQRGTRWQGEDGPLDLPPTGPRSFAALAKECRVTGYSVKALIDHLETNKNIEQLPNGDLKLLKFSSVPDDWIDRTNAAMRNVAKHLSTVSHNIRCEPQDRMFEQVAGRLNVPARKIAAALEELANEGRRSNFRVNKEVFPQFEAQADPNAEYGSDIGMGWFTFHRRND
ncbi:MAG: DUF6502 family protein [Pseudomonadota bacterium]